MMAKKVIVVEDEPLIADDLAQTLENLGYEVIKVLDNADDCVATLRKNKADIALLDINIKGAIDGIMLADIIKKEFGIPFIFITSYTDDDTLNKVKKLGPSGFIVKPFEDSEIRGTIEIALYNTNVENKTVPKAKELKEDNLFVKANGKLVKLSQHDIQWAEAYDNYCYVNLAEKRFLLPSTLKSIESRLDPNLFVRVHRSYLVNLQHITVIGESYLEIGEKRLPVSKRHKSDLINRISLL